MTLILSTGGGAALNGSSLPTKPIPAQTFRFLAVKVKYRRHIRSTYVYPPLTSLTCVLRGFRDLFVQESRHSVQQSRHAVQNVKERKVRSTMYRCTVVMVACSRRWWSGCEGRRMPAMHSSGGQAKQAGRCRTRRSPLQVIHSARRLRNAHRTPL
ncbi:hypothetical protein E2C01_046985 [Portunus trituberculatus]|uniref:Uncharacterized protein n=1 Tax=Portunus trituberculatus TaxID=210409 RepID=A0A5B7FZ74_PORTR|nr:hypothetical protein [Portunus trituberculatus]